MATEVLIQQTATAQQLITPAQRHNVQTTLNYYADPGDGSPPMPVVVGSNTVTNNRPTVPVSVTVHDITGEEDKYTLDGNGFQLVRHATEFSDFRNDEAVEADYLPDVGRLVKEV
jgi:hypothetical protein